MFRGVGKWQKQIHQVIFFCKFLGSIATLDSPYIVSVRNADRNWLYQIFCPDTNIYYTTCSWPKFCGHSEDPMQIIHTYGASGKHPSWQWPLIYILENEQRLNLKIIHTLEINPENHLKEKISQTSMTFWAFQPFIKPMVHVKTQTLESVNAWLLDASPYRLSEMPLTDPWDEAFIDLLIYLQKSTIHAGFCGGLLGWYAMLHGT